MSAMRRLTAGLDSMFKLFSIPASSADDIGVHFHGKWAKWCFGLGLIVATLLTYQPSWRGGELWDDDAHLTSANLESLDGLRRIWFELGATQQYYPLTHSVFWVESHLWGRQPLGYHLITLVLHSIVALIFWGVLRQLAIPGAALAAALFALHPLNVESVAWMSELKNTLSSAFALAATWSFLRFDSTRRLRWYSLAIGLFLLGLLAKSVIAVVPVALLIVLYWKHGKLVLRRDLLPLLPWLFVGLAAGAFTAWVEQRYIGATGSEYSLSLLQRCLIAGRAFWFYLRKLLIPTELTFIYPRWQVNALTVWEYLFPAGAIVLLLMLWGVRRWSRGPLAAILCFIVLLFPALGFVDLYPFRFSFVADHFQYLAGMSVLAMIAAGIAIVLRSFGIRYRGWGWTLIAMLLTLLAFSSWQQCRMYQSAETLWDTTISRNPACWLAYYNRAVLRERQGRPDQALDDLSRAISFNPEYAKALNNRGAIYNSIGSFDRGRDDCDRAVSIEPESPEAYYNRGNAYEGLNRPYLAVADYTKALTLDPSLVMAYNNRGNAYESLGAHRQAIDDYTEAIGIRPNFSAAYHNRGIAYMAMNEYQKAWADVHICRRLGGKVNPAFIRRLAAASGGDQAAP